MENTWNSVESSQEGPASQNFSKGTVTTPPGSHK
uniref:Uncharacterized protein n=1 Tax=Anguilla anguilla TaxID=7936 RepID=A0A0E9V4G9_ANGAN